MLKKILNKKLLQVGLEIASPEWTTAVLPVTQKAKINYKSKTGHKNLQKLDILKIGKLKKRRSYKST